MFKVGDIVRGKEEAKFHYTNENSKCKVVDLRGSEIKVRIIDHKVKKDGIGKTFWEPSRQFVHCNRFRDKIQSLNL
jgi:hypothetical protein